MFKKLRTEASELLLSNQQAIKQRTNSNEWQNAKKQDMPQDTLKNRKHVESTCGGLLIHLLRDVNTTTVKSIFIKKILW